MRLHQTFVLVAILLAGCAAHRVQMPEDAPLRATKAQKRSFSVQGHAWDMRRLHQELEAISWELRRNGFEELTVEGAMLAPGSQSLCDKYPHHVSITANYLGYRDAGGHHFLTGFSLGVIPSWDNDHPHAEFTFNELTECKTSRSVRYVEYRKQLLWLPAAIVGFVVRTYREGECLAGRAIAMNFLNTTEPTFEC